ncbi:MAG: hypothetical protein ACRC1K_18055, partial [Planctomycetia bacterium]
MPRRTTAARLLLGVLAFLAAARDGRAEQFHRQGFEADGLLLKLALTDASVKLIDHKLLKVDGPSSDAAHSGKNSEMLRVQVVGGTYAFAEYSFGQAVVFEDLNVDVWVRASQPGVQLVLRVVLPREIDPATNRPQVTLLRGDKTEVVDRWRRLVLHRPDQMLLKQAQLLQSQRKSPVDLRDAYADMVLFDLHGGVDGVVEVRVDDLQIGPVVRPNADSAAPFVDQTPLNLRQPDGSEARGMVPKVRSAEDKNIGEVQGDRFHVGGKPYLMRGIYRTEAPLASLRDAGCNTLFLPWPVGDSLAAEAEKLGLKTAPMLPFDRG